MWTAPIPRAVKKWFRLSAFLLMAAELSSQPLSQAQAESFAQLALACVHREYPNKIAHTLETDADAKPPRELTPAFYGCFDWHSSVHGHWLLARFARRYPQSALAPRAIAALKQSLSEANLRGEAAYMEAKGRTGFERPYGLAWLLQLALELREWPEAAAWSRALQPVEAIAAQRLRGWLPKLSHAVRSGEHSQTAFALGLVMDWARGSNDVAMEELVRQRALFWFRNDTDAPLQFEPSGEDFLSPALAEADLMRRVLPSADYAAWLRGFLPLKKLQQLKVAVSPDRSDGKLAHLDGLNLSRAWMLEGCASVLPEKASTAKLLRQLADAHRSAGLAAVTGEHYEGGHWLGSFALYLTTGRGLTTSR
jgi:hypothetical protein